MPGTSLAGIRVDPRVAAAPFNALADLGGEGQRAAQVLDRSVEQAASTEATLAAAQARSDWATKLRDSQEAAPLGAEGFTDQTLKGYDDDVKARLDGLSERARPYAQVSFARMRATVTEDAARFESQARVAKAGVDLMQTVNLEANTVRLDPGKFGESWTNVAKALDESRLPPAAKEKFRADYLEDLAIASYQGDIERDPALAKKRFEGKELIGAIKPARWSELLAKNDSEIDRRGRLAQAEVRNGLEDHIASLTATGVGVPGFSSRAGQLLTGEPLAEFRRKEAIATNTHTVMDRIRFATPEDAAAEINRLKPVPGSIGFADRQRAYGHVAEAWDQAARLRAQDPAGYAQQQPEVAAAFRVAASGNDPELQRRAFQTRLAAQESMGVAVPKLLSEGEAKGLVSRFDAMPPTDRAQFFPALEQQYGALWPKAFSELMGHKLDGRYLAVVAVADNPGLGQQIAGAIGAGKEVEKGLDAKDVTAIERQLGEKLNPFLRAIETADPSGGRALQANAMMGGLKAFAVQTFRQSGDMDTAIDRAAAVIADRFHIADSWYMPKVIAGLPMDAGRVEDALAVAKGTKALEAFDPQPLPSSDGRLDETARRQAVIRNATSLGQWATLGDGSGAYLTVQLADGSRLPVVRKGGDIRNPADWYRVDFATASRTARIRPAPETEMVMP